MITRKNLENRKAKIDIYECKREDGESLEDRDFPFIVEDAISVLYRRRDNFKVCHIYNFDADQLEKEGILKEIVNEFEKDHLILTEAYVSSTEFPPEKYYFYPLSKGEKGDKLDLPLDEILKRESDLLEKCGFVNVNNLIGSYEFKVSFAYPNDLGKELKEEIDKILAEESKEGNN